ncbi:Protein similar to cobyrinic acid a,c-diamide synthetase clustered with dissimilatory sulfite reductase [hydrothermal vent metagenome]|uniref:Protein similar to cobyrinic acid a,c-diamide synthetase clustered with dissimilatory sulfite reductase n=1 Tax=hydrothermal vent metagenome TaxID=652676 RepID=A0A3B0ZV26_9ZZZZ
MAHLFISAAHKSSGKTTLTMGLCSALHQRGLIVQPFKKGPDYIDPMWLHRATTRDCYNLDFYTMHEPEILKTFHRYSNNSDIALIEGNKGLYDGLDLNGSNSNAALAKLLNAPVVLVIDARGMTRGIAPLILGYQAFDSDINIAGIIINQLGGQRHESKLRSVIEKYTDVPVIGAVYQNKDLAMVERHLGLIPSNEASNAENKVNLIGKIIAEQVDLDKVVTISKSSTLKNTSVKIQKQNETDNKLNIGFIQDAAFGFYYPDDIQAFKDQGITIVKINSLKDKKLPSNLNGLFIGGGFPEAHMLELSNNIDLRCDIKMAINNGLPVYAECGGLMYLTRSIKWHDETFEMVGAINADTIMNEKPQGRGYVKLESNVDHPWLKQSNTKKPINISAHEFHYSKLINLSNNEKYAYKVLRGTGITNKQDGLIFKNSLACYTHQRNTLSNEWTRHFINHIKTCNYTHA